MCLCTEKTSNKNHFLLLPLPGEDEAKTPYVAGGAAAGMLQPVRQRILSTYKQHGVIRVLIILYQQGLKNAKLNDENPSS